MGRALKYGHGWLISVGGGWLTSVGGGWLTSVGGGWQRKRIYNSRDLPKEGEKKMEGGSWEARGAGSPCPRARGPFSQGHRAI